MRYDRGALPPIRFMVKPTWTAGSIIKHFEKRLEKQKEISSDCDAYDGIWSNWFDQVAFL